MKLFLAMDPLDFLLRYTVIAGMALAMIGVGICMSAKRITMSKRKQVDIDKNDKFYSALICIGLVLIIAGLIVMVLPYENTFYRG